MNTRPKRRPRKPLAVKTAELALAAPQVMARRMLRITTVGPMATRHDRSEFVRMHAEKPAAFFESWNAMLLHALRANQALTASIMRALLTASVSSPASAIAAASRLHRQSLRIAEKGLQPVHRRVLANARRLTRRP